MSLRDGGFQHSLGVVRSGPRGVCRLSGGQTGDGEDRSLGGLHHRLVGGGHAEVQGNGQLAAVDDVLVLHGLGKPPERAGKG